jgi:hypothetical protein
MVAEDASETAVKPADAPWVPAIASMENPPPACAQDSSLLTTGNQRTCRHPMCARMPPFVAMTWNPRRTHPRPPRTLRAQTPALPSTRGPTLRARTRASHARNVGIWGHPPPRLRPTQPSFTFMWNRQWNPPSPRCWRRVERWGCTGNPTNRPPPTVSG